MGEAYPGMVTLKGKSRARKQKKNIHEDLPEDVDHVLERMLRTFDMTDTDDTLRSLDYEIRKNPDSLVPYMDKIDILFRLGRHKEAEDCCRDALVSDKDSIAMHDKIGLILQTSGRPADAVSYHDKAIQLCEHEWVDNRHLAYIYNNKGTALMGVERFDEALECFEKAIKIDPDGGIPYANKQSLLLRMKKR